MTDDFDPPENYYRISIKPLIFDDENRLLVGQDVDGLWAMLGGGWKHDEAWQDCIRRKIREEIGVEVASISEAICFYRHTTPEAGRKYLSPYRWKSPVMILSLIRTTKKS